MASVTQLVSRKRAVSRRDYRDLLLLATGIVGGVVSNSSPVHATALSVSQPFLYYENASPSVLFGAGGELIGYGADNVTPNGTGGTTGFATVAGANGTITRSISYQPSAAPLVPNFFSGSISLAAANNDGINLSSPWTITFQNSGTTPTSVSNTLFLVGPGELPLINSVTISGTTAQPTLQLVASARSYGQRLPHTDLAKFHWATGRDDKFAGNRNLVYRAAVCVHRARRATDSKYYVYDRDKGA